MNRERQGVRGSTARRRICDGYGCGSGLGDIGGSDRRVQLFCAHICGCTGGPFHFTTELGRKPLPLTVNVNAGPPCVVLVGEIVVSTGFRFLMVQGRAFEPPPPVSPFAFDGADESGAPSSCLERPNRPKRPLMTVPPAWEQAASVTTVGPAPG